MVGAGMFDGVITLLWGGIISFLLLIGSVGYIVYKAVTNHHTYESHKIITPTIKLHTDGVKIDTIYIYKFQ